MNRIRLYNNQYEVLITPNYVSTPSLELSLGNWAFDTKSSFSDGYINIPTNNWLDETFINYKIMAVDTLQKAMDISWHYSDINWNKLVSMHKDVYFKIKYTIEKYLNYLNIPVEFKATILTPHETKDMMFDRIKKIGERFNMYYNFNDIICYDIISPYNKILNNIKDVLINVGELNITKIIKTKTHIKLIGINEINTTYEIRLWTSTIFNFMKWIKINHLNIQKYNNQFNKILKLQDITDKNIL